MRWITKGLFENEPVERFLTDGFAPLSFLRQENAFIRIYVQVAALETQELHILTSNQPPHKRCKIKIQYVGLFSLRAP